MKTLFITKNLLKKLIKISAYLLAFSMISVLLVRAAHMTFFTEADVATFLMLGLVLLCAYGVSVALDVIYSTLKKMRHVQPLTYSPIHPSPAQTKARAIRTTIPYTPAKRTQAA
ncbi:MAG: hypothetical protein E7312_07240 [Clostridiales bacterium]|nr:hypothetical protein [Clostridiales bacterium]